MTQGVLQCQIWSIGVACGLVTGLVKKCGVEALVLLSLGSGTFFQAPTLLHHSRGGGSNGPTRWSQLSDKVVLIAGKAYFVGQFRPPFSKVQRGPNSPTRRF